MPDADKQLLQEEEFDLNERVRADRLHLLYSKSLPAVHVSLAASALLCYSMWGQVRPALLLGWLAAVWIGGMFRYALFWAHRRSKPRGLQILDWERPYAVSLFTLSLIWGLGVLAIMRESALLYQLLAFVYLLGMAGGAIVLYSPKRYMAVGAMGSVLLPVSLWMLAGAHVLQVSLGLAALLFMGVLMRTSAAFSAAQGSNFRLAHRLAAARRRSELLAQTDELTGLDNRRAFFDRAQSVVGYCERKGLPLSVIMIDADHFKQINDQHGHAVGDVVLRHLACQLKQNLRGSDVCGRIGGEEFALLLPDTALTEAAALAERIRVSYAAQPVPNGALPVHNTLSLGVVSGSYDLGHLLRCADLALYQAKEAGRDRVVALPCT